MDSTLTYESSFQLSTQSSQPDCYIPGVSEDCRPMDNFIISRHKDGVVLSRYCDDVWLLWPYSTTARQPSPLNFSKFPKSTKSDIKWIVFILIYLTDTSRANTLSPGTLTQYMIMLKKLSEFSIVNHSTPCKVLGSKTHLRNYAHKLAKQGSICRLLPSLLTQLFSLGVRLTGIKVMDKETITEIRAYSRSRYQLVRQHAVIPPRIYSQLLTLYWNTIDIFDSYKKNICIFIKCCVRDPAYGRSRSVQYRLGYRKNNYSTYFNDAIRIHGLSDLFNRFNIHSLRQLSRFLTRVQHICKELIHAYSGMRENEVLSLKFDCLRIEEDKYGKKVHLLGETSKLIGQRKTVAWVTSIEIEKVIRVAKIIAQIVATHKYFKQNKTPLFVSVSYLKLGVRSPNFKVEPVVCEHFNKKQCQAYNLVDVTLLKIQKEDIQHLEKIDPMRAWHEESAFQINKVWNITSHQWRRSLAFYVAQSGLVSLPTLKRQLQHITREMSVYYSNGAGFSDLFNKSEHFMQELKKTKPEADAIAYIYNILLSDEMIKGAHGYHLDNQGAQLASEQNISLNDRKKTIAMFKNGELAYKETALGACTSVEPCDKKLLRSLVSCFSCPKAAIKVSKVSRLIERQHKLVEQLHDNSIEHKTEKKELEELLYLQEKLDVN